MTHDQAMEPKEQSTDSAVSREITYSSILTSFGWALFQRLSPGTFLKLGRPQKTLSRFLEFELTEEAEVTLSGKSDFLDSFLNDAEARWRTGSGGLLRSGTWSESLHDGTSMHLEAIAGTFHGCRLLMLKDASTEYMERQAVFQKARNSVLAHETLIKEIQQKEILLHCIVHDLAGPLMGIESCFAWLEKEELTQSSARSLRTARKAAEKLRALVNDVLEVFSEEVAESERAKAPKQYPFIWAVASDIVESVRPGARLRGMQVDLTLSEENLRQCRVVAETARLERVFYNLLDNALRHCQDDGTVTISISRLNERVRVEVEDQGEGVPAHLTGQLFKKFFKGDSLSGKAGLGLYFCRIVIERWGGTIGYSSAKHGGACFWFELPIGDCSPG